MTCREFDRHLERWMTDAWDDPRAATPAAMREHATGCPECAARLAAATALAPANATSPEPPVDLRLRTMELILSHARSRSAEPDPVPAFPVRGRPAGALWLAAAAAMLVIASSLITVAVMRGSPPEVEVHLFLEAPSARSVSVVGDWNEWRSDADRLADPDGDGVWEITVRVPRPGEYRYQFVVDEDTWMSDPAAPFEVEDGFGGTNSVLDI